jgi:hypothetical protein
MLSIGSVQGGPEVANFPIGAAVAQLMGAVSNVRDNFEFGASSALNVVFHIPGSVAPEVGYEGLRDGTFSKARRLLMVQVAVPKHIAACKDERIVWRYVFGCLREANKMAARFFAKKGMKYSEQGCAALLDAVEAKEVRDP